MRNTRTSYILEYCSAGIGLREAIALTLIPSWGTDEILPTEEIEYRGNGKWNLPEGASIRAESGDGDWLLVIAGKHWRLWTNE